MTTLTLMDAVSEIKARLSVEDVVSEYVALKRAGRNFKGLSPFTNEKSPSFVVSPEKQIWHDFSSGRGGDMFTFVEEIEGLDFKGTLELLARKAGVDLEQFQSKGAKRGPDKARLLAALQAAAKFYQQHFKATEAAYTYILRERGYSKETVLEFCIGYSPNQERALTDFLLKKGYSEQEIKAAGLGTMRRGGLGDMFRGRIMVPLMDPAGQVIGFTARLLNDEPNAPKYINTPSTVLYDKSRHVFGLHLAKKTIREQGFSVLVEGNMDVIASHQAGVKEVVATAGTALTEAQLKTLVRFSPDVRLAFDQDRAGLAAAERAIPIASRVGVDLSIITIPSGKDPDELIKQNPELWKQAINSKEYAFDWLLERYKADLDLESAQGKKQFSTVLLGIVRGLEDATEQDHYLSKISEASGINIEALRSKLQKTNSAATNKRLKVVQNQYSPETSKKRQEQYRTISQLLSLAYALPALRESLALVGPEMIEDPAQRQILEFLKKYPQSSPSEAPELQPLTDYVKILSLLYEELYSTVDTLELHYEAARLVTKVVENFVKQQKTLLAGKLQNAEGSESQELLTRVRELDQLLKKSKRTITR